jgi:UDP:flavonoid glycosyltransferase YjiC (YdhE family)
MRITILSVGSRGDVQPNLALGLALQRAGHTVTLAASGIFERWIQEQGLGFVLIRYNPQGFSQSREVQQTMHAPSKNPLRFLVNLSEFIRHTQSLYTDMYNDIWQACQGADFIIASTVAFAGCDCAAKLNRPSCLALLQPQAPTTEFSSFNLPPWLSFGGRFNHLTHLLAEKIMWWLMGSVYNRWRQNTLAFPPLREYPLTYYRAARLPAFYAYSPTVLPKPRDWPAWYHVTGYWFLETSASYQPPSALLQFLGAGPPPVYIGFGSTVPEDPHRLTKIALDALQLAGQRGVLLSGWAGLSSDQLPETVFCLEDVPHAWLFTNMAAVVHHGGAGTTGASLRAGIPTLVTPFALDQFAWGKVVADLGVGPKAIPSKKLTAEKLAEAIQTTVTDKVMRERATDLGKKIRAEDGIGQAMELMAAYLT